MRLSVVVPVGRREDSIPELIDAAAHQELERDDYEVVIVDRTPGQHYAPLTEETASASGTRFVYRCIDDWSRAVAINVGIMAASNEVILCLGEDFVPPPTVFSGHLAYHRAHPESWRALMGPAGRTRASGTHLTHWHERVVAPYRPPPGADRDDVSPFDTSVGNVSVKREFFLAHGTFDEDFAGEGFEDIDLFVRLHGRGLRVSFDPALEVVHDHPTDLREMLLRWRICGRMARTFDSKHPDLRQNVEPQDATLSTPRVRYDCATNRLLSFIGSDVARERYYLKRAELAFLKGYNDPPRRMTYPYELEDAMNRLRVG